MNGPSAAENLRQAPSQRDPHGSSRSEVEPCWSASMPASSTASRWQPTALSGTDGYLGASPQSLAPSQASTGAGAASSVSTEACGKRATGADKTSRTRHSTPRGHHDFSSALRDLHPRLQRRGLEQDFNSLDAQRESAEAYIKSRAHEGWRLVRERFDDGGYSGGSTDRPALQR